MNLLVLAAGYGTRLYPLTRQTAKPLIEVGGKPMVEHVLESFSGLEEIQSVHVVTNNKFAAAFEDWSCSSPHRWIRKHVKIVNDGSDDESSKLGAIGDLHFTINREDFSQDDLLVVGGDNLFERKQHAFVEFAKHHPVSIGTFDTGSRSEVRKFASISTGEDFRITAFEEKPRHPASTLAGIALYYFRRDALPLINQYVTEGNNPDQAGHLIQWLSTRLPTYGYPIQGQWHDIGSHEDLERARRSFES